MQAIVRLIVSRGNELVKIVVLLLSDFLLVKSPDRSNCVHQITINPNRESHKARVAFDDAEDNSKLITYDREYYMNVFLPLDFVRVGELFAVRF